MKRKAICKAIVAIAVALAFVMPGAVAFANVEGTIEGNQASAIVREIDNPVFSMSVEMSEIVSVEKSSEMAMLDSTMIYDTEYDDFHPTVAGDSDGRFFAGFELTMDGTDYYPDFWYSLDGGSTWVEAGYFIETLGSEYPDADSNDNGFYFTFGPPDANGGQEWLGIAEDLTAITALIWDFSPHGFNDFEYMSISCYTRPDEPWNPGGLAASGYNGYSGNDLDGCPYIFYPISANQGAISWLVLEHYYHADIAIDEVTEISYAVYDNTVDANLLVRKDNFGAWTAEGYHPEVASYDVGDGETNLMNPSIEANNNTVVLVAEAEGNIVCFYSDNGFASVQQSIVADSAMYPEVMMSFNGVFFVCSYVKDGAVYVKVSEDGGATWKYETQVEDSEVESEYGTHDLGKALTGIFAVWEDNRNPDIDIYFGEVLAVKVPELDIISIEGGLGVTTTIKNTGEANATNVILTLTVKGGLLGLIDKTVWDTIPSLAVGEESDPLKTGIFFGLGKIVVEVTATCDEGSSDSETKTGMQIIIFTRIS